MADAKAETAAVIEDLRERLQKAEVAAEEAHKQHAVTQARLDDTSKEHNSIEESMHEQEERLEQLENEKKESIRQRREFEAIYEAERAQSMKDKEELQVREEELRDTIQRLKETMAQKEMRGEDERRQSISRACKSSHTLIVRHHMTDSFLSKLQKQCIPESRSRPIRSSIFSPAQRLVPQFLSSSLAER
jgi:chromosome segregation ATPase